MAIAISTDAKFNIKVAAFSVNFLKHHTHDSDLEVPLEVIKSSLSWPKMVMKIIAFRYRTYESLGVREPFIDLF